MGSFEDKLRQKAAANQVAVDAANRQSVVQQYQSFRQEITTTLQALEDNDWPVGVSVKLAGSADGYIKWGTCLVDGEEMAYWHLYRESDSYDREAAFVLLRDGRIGWLSGGYKQHGETAKVFEFPGSTDYDRYFQGYDGLHLDWKGHWRVNEKEVIKALQDLRRKAEAWGK